MASEIENMTLAQLEMLINSRKSKLTDLYKRRDQLVKNLASINEEIAANEGPGVRSRPPRFTRIALTNQQPVLRAQNEKSLKAHIEEALKGIKKGLTISEIQEVVLKNGYTTHSANFKNTIYQCLYHNERTFLLDKRTKAYKLNEQAEQPVKDEE